MNGLLCLLSLSQSNCLAPSPPRTNLYLKKHILLLLAPRKGGPPVPSPRLPARLGPVTPHLEAWRREAPDLSADPSVRNSLCGGTERAGTRRRLAQAAPGRSSPPTRSHMLPSRHRRRQLEEPRILGADLPLSPQAAPGKSPSLAAGKACP